MSGWGGDGYHVPWSDWGRGGVYHLEILGDVCLRPCSGHAGVTWTESHSPFWESVSLTLPLTQAGL